MADRYLTVAGTGVHEIEIRRSRFLCALAPVTSEEAARSLIAGRRKAEPAARHHCHAFVLGADGRTQRSSDDGEPAGTAGTPMLEVLRRRELTDTVAVVTRYFGGVLLGAGGLIRAYGQAVSEAVDVIGVREYRRLRLVEVVVDYDRAGRLENDIRSSPYLLHATRFEDVAHFDVGLAPDQGPAFHAWLADLTGGEALAEEIGETWLPTP
ncbi:YigZ family protein [Amycolatopsis roodepoortensis]|uniref:YigZ family protein n=1 Tax=Amycolatopsis roodepoortensis TaxID=700274 RepID=UPI000F86E855|nr:YigZ family protein [Amycolatopsis roodepoortensis]RSN12205.1 YigZ family protein [Streptomyces sp. WAC 05977]UUV34606.1 YigZ family protein [Amycolatopsis roodepoortensis]